MLSPEPLKTPMPRSEPDAFVYPNRSVHSDENVIRTNPLDELDCVNHYCYGGRKNLNRDFLVLCVNDHSPGDETIFLAVQLMGTESRIVHFDWSPAAMELVRTRAKRLGVAERICWCCKDLENVHSIFKLAESDRVTQKRPSRNDLALQRFDYVRCCGALDRLADFETHFDTLLAFLKPEGALGMTCLGKYGREPYRQFQKIARFLGEDRPSLQDEVDRLKELFVFLPEYNWTRLAFENLQPEIRSMKDEAFIAHFLRQDVHSWTVSQLYELLERKNLDLANFSRQTRRMYQPWFARKNHELFRLMQNLPVQDTQAISEMAWNSIEEHVFWATRRKSARADLSDLESVPFFNPVVLRQKPWKRVFLETPLEIAPKIALKLSREERYEVTLPWNREIRRFVDLIDGYRTLGEIVTQIREEENAPEGIEEIVRSCRRFIDGCELEDILLVRHKSVPVLPFTASAF